jgi:hypothetical protein
MDFEFWILDGGLKTMLNVGFWILDGIQHSEFRIQNFAASAAFSGEAVFLQEAVGFICRHGGNRPNWW